MATKHKTLAQQIAELQNPNPQDIDPEDIGFGDDALGGEPVSDVSDFEEDEQLATQHYEELGKSKLRKSTSVALGAAYRGSKVSRAALQSSDEEDPFEQDYESSDSGIEGLDNRDEEQSVASSREDEKSEEDDEHVSEDGFDDDDEVSEEEDLDSSRRSKRANGSSNINELRRLVLEDQKAVASSLSQARKTDVEKGQAIRAQRSAFDALLNVRIKLQPGLVATNSMLVLPTSADEHQEGSQSVAAAEAAALKLWQTVDDIKCSLFEARTGQKRKRSDSQTNSDLEVMWQSMQDYEKDCQRQRNSNLDTWASRTRATMNAAQGGRRLIPVTSQQSLTDVLTGQLSEMSRLVAKTTVPRSCAPIQASAPKGRFTESPNGDSTSRTLPIYDDADFYGPLLQTLVSQRSSDAAALSAMNVSFVSQPWQAMREAKTKKMVDTKASKGRKLRYTVHEKLQNIMAAENRATWSDRQCDDLFASLQGRTMALDERFDDVESEDVEDVAAQSLRLFAS